MDAKIVMSISPSISNVCEREEKEKECGQSYGKEQHRLEFQAAEAAKSIMRSANTSKLKHWNINLQRLCEDYHAAKAICWIDGATEGTDRHI